MLTEIPPAQLPSDEVLHGGLHFLHIFVRQAQEGPGRDFDAHLFLGDQIAVAHVTDKYSEYPSNGLTPVKLAEILKEADPSGSC